MSNAKSTAKQRAIRYRQSDTSKLLRAPVVTRNSKSKRVMGLNPR